MRLRFHPKHLSVELGAVAELIFCSSWCCPKDLKTFAEIQKQAGRAWWSTAVIPARVRLRQENREFETSLGDLARDPGSTKQKQINFSP